MPCSDLCELGYERVVTPARLSGLGRATELRRGGVGRLWVFRHRAVRFDVNPIIGPEDRSIGRAR